LAAREQCVLVADRDWFPGAFGKQLALAAALHGNEPPDCFLDRLASSQEAMITHDDGLPRAQRGSDARAFARLVDNAGEVLEYAVIFIKGARILRDRIEQSPQRGP